MIPTYIGFKKGLYPEEPVIALDAGGTNLRSAIISFNKSGTHELKGFAQSRMPGVDREVDAQEFFNAIADNLGDKPAQCSRLGFVFSYPIEIYPDRDGRLIKFTKEIKAKQVEGCFIGRSLLEVLKKRGNNKIKDIVLLNDTVALPLAGIVALRQRQYSSYVGLVLGTGMNVCYIEKNSNIVKLPNGQVDPSNFQLVNIEAGGYLGGPCGKIDEEFDRGTRDPGLSTYEKMFSGAYLGSLATEVISFAVRDELFSSQFCNGLKKFGGFASRDIDDYLYFPPQGDGFTILAGNMESQDKVLLYFLFDDLIERAAVLTAVVLSSAIIKSEAGFDPTGPVCIVAEGSSFYKMKNFGSRLDYYMKKALSTKGSYYFEINRVDDAVMVGAAAAGLSPCC
jgi:hexokinase